MNPINIKNYRDINLTKLNFTHPKKTRGGSYISLITYDDNNEKIFIQTPKITTTTGICNHDTRSYIELQFNKNHLSFYDFLISLDETNIKIVNNNSKEWFEQELPLDIIDEFYKPNIKIRKNLAPKIKFKIPVNKGDVLCNIYNDSHQLINSNDIKENDKVVLIIELIGLKFLKQQFNLEWKVSQIKLYQNLNINNCIINDNYLSDNQYSDNEIDEELDKLENSFSNEIEENLEDEKQFNISDYKTSNEDVPYNRITNLENTNQNQYVKDENIDNTVNNNENLTKDISMPNEKSKNVTFSEDYDSDYSEHGDNLGEFIELIEKPIDGIEEFSLEAKDQNNKDSCEDTEFKNTDIAKIDYKTILESTQQELNNYKDKYESEVRKLEIIKNKYNKIWE